MNQVERSKLALKVYETVLDGTESFEVDNIGSHLAYLMGAILKGPPETTNGVGMTIEDEGAREFVGVLRALGSTSPVWGYIQLLESKSLDAFPERVRAAIIEGKRPGNLDEEDFPEAAEWVGAPEGEEAPEREAPEEEDEGDGKREGDRS